jgi:GTP-binding protein
MRRQVQIQDPVEYFSFLRSRGTLHRVDVAILVVDASEGVTSHDQRIANAIEEAGRACVIALNKWDLVTGEGPDRDRFDRSVETALRFLPWATQVRTSAKSGRRVDKLLPAVEGAVAAHRTRVATSLINKVVREAQAEKPHARSAGRAIRILYSVQARTAPPTVILFSNGRLETSYLRYLERKIRETEPFQGAPLRLEVRVKRAT